MTRALRFGVVAAAILLLGAFSGQAQAGVKQGAAKSAKAESTVVVTPREQARRLIVFYFHTTQRCASCRAIEAYSREAIESAFADSLRSGGIVWRVVNIDEKDNRHFVKDYQLYTKSLVVVNEMRGRPPEWKNLSRIWELLPDRPAFLKYVQAEVRAYLAARS